METKASNGFLKKISLSREAILFYLLLGVQLLPFLFTTYFVTTDGPCHLYNASVLRDWLLHRDTDFFHRFYLLNHHPDPNWFSHIILAGLLMVMSAVMAEKLFLIVYVIGMALSVRALIRYISPGNSWLSFLVFPFIYTHIFQLGFYNYSYSLILMVICIWYFLRYIGTLTVPVFVTIGIVLSMLCFMAHPVGYVLMLGLTFGLIALQYLSQILAGNLNSRYKFLIFLKKLGIATAINIIPVILIVAFIRRKSGDATIPNTDPFDMKWQSFVHLKSLVLFNEQESSIVSFIPYLFAVLILFGLYYKVRSRKLSAYDVFLPMAIATGYYYFHAPNRSLGGSQIAIRFQFLPFFLSIFWLASFSFHRAVKLATIAVMMIMTVALMALRFPSHIAASELACEYMSTASHIAPRSVVIPLTYTHFGKTPDGKNIADRAKYFLHTADYIGTTKPLIMLGNYEGDTGYFPLIWQQDKNPFGYLAANDGIESLPPSISISAYRNKSGADVDYVILLCLDSEFIYHPYTVDLLKQLEAYDLIYTSDHGRAKLYKKKDIVI